jgi:hypothetical protein
LEADITKSPLEFPVLISDIFWRWQEHPNEVTEAQKINFIWLGKQYSSLGTLWT